MSDVSAAELNTETNIEPSAQDDIPLPSAAACETCGTPVETLDRFCGSCGATHQLAMRAAESQEPIEQKFFRCENCGAQVATDPDQRSYVCPFCDSNYVVEFSPDQSDRQRPEFVIGFALTHEQAMKKFQQWISASGLFQPGDLARSRRVEDKLKGVYLPFWSFSMLASSRWRASIGEYWWKTETYTTTENGKTVTKTRRVRKTEWWPLCGEHHRYYSGYLVTASRGLPQREAERIKPFHLPALRRYEPMYLAGWLSEEFSLPRSEALERCRNEFFRREQRSVAQFMPGDTHRELDVKTDFSDTNSDLILLPIYLLSYRYQNKLYRFMVNGQTGKIAGDKPLSWRRISAAIAAGLSLLAIIILFFIVMQS